MKPENRELFRRLREKASLEGIVTADTIVGSLPPLLNSTEHETVYLGKFRFADSETDYYLVEWTGEAAVCRVEAIGDTAPPVYTLVDFDTDEEGLPVRLRAVYSSAAPKTMETDPIGPVCIEASEEDSYIKGMLLETLDAQR